MFIIPRVGRICSSIFDSYPELIESFIRLSDSTAVEVFDYVLSLKTCCVDFQFLSEQNNAYYEILSQKIKTESCFVDCELDLWRICFQNQKRDTEY